MRLASIIVLAASLAACKTSNLGSCADGAACPAGSTCDASRQVCVIPADQCFPLCTGAEVCDPATLKCIAAQTADVAVTSPAPNAVVSGTLQAAATAHAPGGVTAVSFELRDGNGALLVLGAGTVSASDSSAWTGSLALNGVAAGAASLTAVATFPGGSKTSAPVAVTVQSNACFPSCPAGQVCQNGGCVSSSCNPLCDSAHVCVNGSCQASGAAAVTLTSPIAGAYLSGTVQATATATAPGGVSAVRFDLSTGGSVAATAQGAPSSGDPSNFSATLGLAGVLDGPATLKATATFSGGTASSTEIGVTVDQTAPAITLTRDGRGAFIAGGQSVSVTATIDDGSGSGVQDSTVALNIAGHAAIAGAGASGAYTFDVQADDSLAPAGAAAIVLFSLSARDKAGNAATLSGDAREVIQIDRDAPAISGLAYAPAPFDDGAGHLSFGAGGDITVTATIADGAGVDPATVCLRLTGETGACAHPGTAGASDAWTFTLPRPAAPQDGSAAFSYTIEADDSLASHLTGARQAEHQLRSAQSLTFDYTAPAVTIAADTTPYARTAVPIPVNAFVDDPGGIPDGGVVMNGNIQAIARDGGLFTFQLDPRLAPAGVEGAFGFTVTARDNANNSSGAISGSRVIDDKAPAATALRVFKGTDPGTAGVTYPAAVPNTGWTGTSFVYSDTVHVKGSLADVSGIGTATVRVDGIGLDGGVSTGTARSLGCTAGATTCAFDVQFALNDLAGGNGQFHTGNTTVTVAGTLVPSGTLKVVMSAQDQAKSADDSAAAHSASASNDATTTRFLWQQTVTGAAVSGLAVHPDGDVIATTDGGAAGTDSVFDLAPDQPLVRWSYGSDAGTPVGAVFGGPAIGAGTAATARTYVASGAGNLYAINPNGSVAWLNVTAATLFSVAPAVAQATISGNTVDEVVVPDGVGGGNSKLWRGTSATDVTNVASGNRDFHAPPLILNGKVFFGNQNAGGTTTHLESHTIGADGALGATAAATANGVTPYYGVITDGTSLYASTRAATAGILQKLDTSFTAAWTRTLTTSGFAGESTIGIDGLLYAPDLSNTVTGYNAGTGAPVAGTAIDFGGVPMTPLQGSDGHLYAPRRTGFLGAWDGNQLSWIIDPPGSAMRYAIMDCSGRLFFASGPTVYALVTDDRGLADTAWPSVRRDARNTGNAGAIKYGMRTATGCVQ